MTEPPADGHPRADCQTNYLQNAELEGFYVEKAGQKDLDSEEEEDLVNADSHSEDAKSQG